MTATAGGGRARPARPGRAWPGVTAAALPVPVVLAGAARPSRRPGGSGRPPAAAAAC